MDMDALEWRYPVPGEVREELARLARLIEEDPAAAEAGPDLAAWRAAVDDALIGGGWG